MRDNMRNYSLRLSKYNISRGRYKELKALFLQYDEIKSEINRLIILPSCSFDIKLDSSVKDSTVEISVRKRAYLLSRLSIIEQSIKKASNNEKGMSNALIMGLCYNIGYERIKTKYSFIGRKEYFHARRMAFCHANEIMMSSE